jgi:adenosylmethionine-8-amino-7-oxononanoate aminotransferase
MIVHPRGYLDRLYALCKDCDIHIILDEVATGFGRTGRMFGHQHGGIVPDFLCLSKSLTNGTLPMAATLTTDDIYDAFYDDYLKGKTFFHGHTFTGNPVSASAALATIGTILGRKLVPGSRTAGRHLAKRLEIFRQGPASEIVGDIRQIGLVAAIELVSDPASKRPLDPKLRFGWQTFLEGLKHNLLWRPLGDVLYFFLPLTVTEKEIDDIVDRAHRTLNESFRKHYKPVKGHGD